MAALKGDLQRVLADEAYVLEPQLIRRQALDSRQPAQRTCLAAALGARAGPAKLLARVRAAVAVLPGHVHNLAFAVDVDGDWKRVRVLQLPSA